MIWLAWRRHRLLLVSLAAVVVLLGGWMAVVTHSFEVAARTPPCLGNLSQCNRVFHGWASTQQQSALIDLLLFLLPAAIGAVLGAPLVAGELEHHTNRLAWTQGISRLRWVLTSWLVVALVVAALTGSLELVVQWWSSHVLVNFLETHAILGPDRIQPRLFAVTGIAPVAYSVFAFSLGAALGALFRRAGWAAFTSIVLYGIAALFVVLAVRPNLVTPVVVPPHRAEPASAWSLGWGFRFGPGAHESGSLSTTQVVHLCANEPLGSTDCLKINHIQLVNYYQPLSRYWPLQWTESAVYLAAAIVLLGVTVLAVKRWRA
jgi:uncharacterized membrane protein YoaK (UPF0700 family)